jgi:hypothetical protein
MKPTRLTAFSSVVVIQWLRRAAVLFGTAVARWAQ